jgi:hypothetical protein
VDRGETSHTNDRSSILRCRPRGTSNISFSQGRDSGVLESPTLALKMIVTFSGILGGGC